LGVCGLYDRDGLDGIDIGFALLPCYEGNGFAFEAADKLLNVAINQFKISTIKAITTKENIQSQKLLEKLGLNFAGIFKMHGDDEELMLYQINTIEN
jgi:RimJ/RimL family protein N-acetyltransferase